jgi:hypothetical protein
VRFRPRLHSERRHAIGIDSALAARACWPARSPATYGIWHILFLLVAYGSALVCLYATYRIGVEQGWRWGVIHLLIFCGFVLLFWLLESYAASRTPYFSYPLPPNGLPDAIGFLPFAQPPALKNWCLVPVPENVRIPFSVLLLEATLTFSAGHTARLLASSKELRLRMLRPLMAALALLAFDFFLDPLSSVSSSCAFLGGPTQAGLGFWEWYVVPELGPDSFGVPLFNYVLWYAMPIVLIALIGLLGWFFDFFLVPIVVGASGTITFQILFEGAFLLLIVFAFSMVIAFSPNFAYLPVATLREIFVGYLLLTLILILYYARFFNYWNTFRWWFVAPQAAFLLFCVIAFLGSGLLTKLPYLALVGFVVSVLFTVWMLSPYWKKIFP